MLWSLIANAIVLSSVYVLFSTGFTLVYGSFRVMNMAHGAILTVGAFVGIFITNSLGLPLVVAAVAAAVAAGLLNAAMNAVIIQPIQRRTSGLNSAAEELTPVIATIAVTSIIAGVLFNSVAGVSYVFSDSTAISESVEMLGVHVSVLDILVVATALILSVGIHLLINKTRAGVRIRAVAEDRHMSEALGIRSSLVGASVFFLSGALAGVTGVAVGLLYGNVNPVMGEQLLLLGFIIVTVGGIGSLKGTLIAAVIVAFVKTFASAQFSVPVVTMFLFGVLLLTLLVRPSGIMGTRVLGSGVARV